MRKDRSLLEMVTLARAGNTDAVNGLIAVYRERALRRFQRHRRFASDAQDLAQEFTIRLWRALQRLRDDRGFWRTAWAVARGVLADHNRRHRETESLPAEDVLESPRPDRAAPFLVAGRSVDRHWLLDQLEGAMSALSPTTRHILRGRLAGHRVKHLATACHVSEASVKTRLHRGRHRLRSMLEDRAQQRSRATYVAGGETS